MKKVTLPNLNGLRFLAALGVTVHHIEQIKQRFGMLDYWQDPGIFRLGGLCVSLFFVLSGFLITYLLLEELHVYHSISVAKFYLRRMLRIWPLYFFLCLLCFFVLPCFRFFDLPGNPPPFGPGWGPELLAYFLLSPHWATAFMPGAVSFVGVLWSVGVEEWFYALWPWIMRYSRRWLLHILLAIVVLMPTCRVAFHLLKHNVSLSWFLDMLRFDCMAMGGLFALLLHTRNTPWSRRILSRLYNPNVQLGLYLFTAYAMINGKNYDFVNLGVNWSDQTVYSFLFGAIILNLAGNPHSILNLENRVMHWLGNLSYGMYCYNWITSVSAVKLVLLVWPGNHPRNSSLALLDEVLSLVLVLVASALSYEFMERRFLLLKQRPSFSRLITMPATTIKAEG